MVGAEILALFLSDVSRLDGMEFQGPGRPHQPGKVPMFLGRCEEQGEAGLGETREAGAVSSSQTTCKVQEIKDCMVLLAWDPGTIAQPWVGRGQSLRQVLRLNVFSSLVDMELEARNEVEYWNKVFVYLSWGQ